MKKYSVGIMFKGRMLADDMGQVALIEKQRPDWQKGLFNFPGGHIEDSETPLECIVREFKEETGMTTDDQDWRRIGLIRNEDKYELHVFTAKYDHDKHGPLHTTTDEQVYWGDSYRPFMDRYCLSNVPWLILFAINYWKQGNADQLKFGTFEYAND